MPIAVLKIVLKSCVISGHNFHEILLVPVGTVVGCAVEVIVGSRTVTSLCYDNSLVEVLADCLPQLVVVVVEVSCIQNALASSSGKCLMNPF